MPYRWGVAQEGFKNNKEDNSKMKKTSIISMVLVIALAIVMFAGCTAAKPAETAAAVSESVAAAPASEEPAPSAAESTEPAAKKIKIGISMQGLDAPYVVSVKKHLEAAVAAAGPDVEAIILDGQANAEKQVSQVENFIAQKVDAIILNPIAYDGCAPAVEAASKAGIPILTLITRVQNQDLTATHSGSDHKESGIIEAQAVADYLQGKGNIVVIEGVMGIDAQIQRMEGYNEVLAKYPDIKIVAQNTAAWQRDQALDLVENWLQSGKEFTVVLAQNDNMAMGALKAIEDAGLADKIKVFGIDGDNDALQAVKDGRLMATVFQDAKGQAETAINAAITLAGGGTVDKEYIIPFQLVTTDNVDDFLK
jgi:inositol transport system substrate-binding protein